MSTPNPALQIPGYRIIRRLGRGGMATVYLASQESLSRLVAIKVLASEEAPNEELVRRFENEAHTIARLDHPHIVSIFDVGRTSGGQIYYTMPYLPNGDLAERNVHDDPLRILGIVRALAEALGSAHDLGIVHRDVKPENVLFDALDRPMLADFGIALSGSEPSRVTREGATIGSSGYMSPEQARGQATDGRSDLYSLGVVCYELLTGEMPFAGADALAMALAHIEKPIPRLPITRRSWQPLIDRALAKQADARFQSAEELLAALDVIGRRLQAPAPTGLARWWRALLERAAAIPRRRRVVAACVVLLLALAALLALLPHVPERTASPPALPVAASTPTPAPDAAAAAPESDAAAPTDAVTAQPPPAATDPALREQRLREAATLVARGHLVSPGDDNAAERYLAILASEPGQREAITGLRRILDSLAGDAARSITAGNGGAAIAPITLGITIAGRAKLLSGAAFSAFVAPIQRAVEERRARASGPLGAATLGDLKPLLPTLARIDSAQTRGLQADFDQLAARLRGEVPFHDPGGPSMVVVPAGRLEHALAVSVEATSHGAYARFAASTTRTPARCRESQRLFARSRGLDWRNPGVAQGDDAAVVCVSWEDANAYAQWLSRRSDTRYRLPTREEWAILPPTVRAAGDPGLWIEDCAEPANDANGCREREFRGLPARNASGKPAAQRSDTSAADIGYANVGFRLVRELPASVTAP